MTRARRARCIVGAALAALAVTPTPALGATVFHVPGDFLLGFLADPGEANRVTVTQDSGFVTVTDDGVAALQIAPGSDCAPVAGSLRSARCPDLGIARIDASMGDLDDALTSTTAVAVDVRGEAGNDSLHGGSGSDDADGGPGNDVIDGGAGADRLFGAVRNDAAALAGADTLNGGLGADVLVGGAGPDLLDGGGDNDTVSGGAGDDTLSGAAGADQITTGEGDDVAYGGDDDDIVGTAVTTGVEQRSQEPGRDVLYGELGNDTLDPGPGPVGGLDADTLSGGAGIDRLSYGGRTLGVQASKDDAADDGYPGEGDNIGADVEVLLGGAGDDVMQGGADADIIEGGGGNDMISGLGGNDVLRGDGENGAGRDTIAGGAGSDLVEGNDGEDKFVAGAGSDTVNGGTGVDTVAYAANAAVTVRLDSGVGGIPDIMQRDAITKVENVEGGAQQDTITGDGGANVVDTAEGQDYAQGGAGRDTLQTGGGADFVHARDRENDGQVSCGPGVDFALLDRLDQAVRSGPNRCEQVDDGKRTRPQSGRELLVQPRRCGAPGAELEIRLPAMSRVVPLRDQILVPIGQEPRTALGLETEVCTARVTVSGEDRRATSSVEIFGGGLKLAPSPGRRATAVLWPDRPRCDAHTRAASSRPRDRENRVRVSTRGRGRLRVKGRYSNAASYATSWTTIEECDRTITRVISGHVRVFDRVRRRSKTLGPGQEYVARARR